MALIFMFWFIGELKRSRYSRTAGYEFLLVTAVFVVANGIYMTIAFKTDSVNCISRVVSQSRISLCFKRWHLEESLRLKQLEENQMTDPQSVDE